MDDLGRALSIYSTAVVIIKNDETLATIRPNPTSPPPFNHRK